MKKVSLIMILALCSLILFSGLVMAEEVEADYTGIEITDGVIEFQFTPFARESVEEDNWNDPNVTRRLFNVDGGTGYLEAEFTGVLFNDVDWEIFVSGNNTRFSLAKEFDTFGVGVGSGEDTYIQYKFTDDFDLTLKPRSTSFAIGSELRTFLQSEPKIEANYKLSEEMNLSGTFWTTGESWTNGNVDTSEREILLKSALDYETDTLEYEVGLLLDFYREDDDGDDIKGRPDWNGISILADDYDIPRENFIVNTLGELELNDTLTLNGEAKFSLGGYTNESWVPVDMLPGNPTEVEASRVDFGLYAKLTQEFNNETEIYGSYKLERTSSSAKGKNALDNNYEREITKLNQRFMVGSKMPLEEGLSLVTDIYLSPGSITIDDDNAGVETDEDWSYLDMGITTALRYEF